MSLSAGDAAPTFSLPDSDTEAFSLDDARSDGPVVLLFFPGAFTGVCTTELNTVGNDYSRYTDLGAQVVGISTDSPFALAEFKRQNGFPFRLLSDHDAEVSAAYGVKYDGDFTDMNLSRVAKRSAFVVREDGTLAYAEVTENAGVEPDYGAIQRALEDEGA